MLGFLTLPAPIRRLLPQDRLAGPTAWLMAIMLFVTVVVAAAGLTVAHAAQLVEAGVERRWSLEVNDGRLDARALAGAARRLPGVASAEPVSEDEMREMLGRWLGPLAQSAALPLPAVVDVQLAAGADPERVGRALGAALPGARFIAHEARLGPVLRVVRMLGWLTLGIVALMGLAAAAAVVLATRGAFDTHRQTLEILHGVGATDTQVTRLFMRQIALEALVGGVAGTLAALLVLAALVGGGTALGGALAGAPLLGLADLALLLALPLAGAAMATLVARATVGRALREQL